MKTYYKKITLNGGAATINLTLTGMVGESPVDIAAEDAVKEIKLSRKGVSGFDFIKNDDAERSWEADDNVLTVHTGKLSVGRNRMSAFVKAGTNTGTYVVLDLLVPVASNQTATVNETVSIVDTFGDGSGGGVSQLVFGERTVVEVDEDGAHIYNANGDEIGTFTEDGISLGHHDGLHLDVAVTGQTAISDGSGNHIVEVEGSNLYFNTQSGDNRFKFDAATGTVSVSSPDGSKELQFTSAIIDAINALVTNAQ